MQNGGWAICMELFASGVPCKSGYGRSAWNFLRPEFHAKRGMGDLHGTFCVRSSMQNGGMADLHGTFRVRSSMQNGIWAICMEFFASGVPCKTGEWPICMELFASGVPCKTGVRANCMELFASGVPCKTGNGRSAWNFPHPEFHAKRGMADLHGM